MTTKTTLKRYFRRLWAALLNKDYLYFPPTAGRMEGNIHIYGIQKND